MPLNSNDIFEITNVQFLYYLTKKLLPWLAENNLGLKLDIHNTPSCDKKCLLTSSCLLIKVKVCFPFHLTTDFCGFCKLVHAINSYNNNWYPMDREDEIDESTVTKS